MRNIWLLIVFGSIAVGAYATDRYVSLDGTNDAAGGYTNWAGAATSIIAAVNVAAEGETIWVTNGLYKLTNQITLGNNTLRSWNNGATDRDGTIIDGNNYTGKPVTNRCVQINVAGGYLDGFTISNGFAAYGGGVLMSIAGVITNCIITLNEATRTTAWSGGGVAMYGAGGKLTHCNIISNRAPDSGVASAGGVLASGTDTKVINCEISGNTAYQWAGLYIDGGCMVSNCMISGNTATLYGGGFTMRTGGGIISHCIISNNSAGTISGAGGGGAHMAVGGTIRNCTFVDNNSGRQGGGIYIYIPQTNLIVENCLFANNHSTANHGGGIYLFHVHATLDGLVQIINCTLASNSAHYTAGGLYVEVGALQLDKVYIENTIVAGNSAELADDDIRTTALGAGDAGVTNCFSYCCSPTYNSFPPDKGNVETDPLFVSSTNFRLQAGSPCINTGTNETWMTNAMDLDGRRRIDYFNRHVDMGAYEYLFTGIMFKVR